MTTVNSSIPTQPMTAIDVPGTELPGGSSHQSAFSFPRPTDDLVKNAKILIFDEDVATTRHIHGLLTASGFIEVHTLSDSRLALTQINSSQPDLLLLDLTRPDIGREILIQLRATPNAKQTPVLALTSDDGEGDFSALLELGVDDYLKKPISSIELLARVRNTLSSKVAYDQLLAHSEKLQKDVLRDTLTGTANRRAFDFELNRKMLEWNRTQTYFSLLLIDIDHFKRINDTFGHQAGDAALRSITDLINKSSREIDLVCRVGGEEFAVIMPGSRKADSVRAAERIRQSVANATFPINGQDLQLTISVGIANTIKGDDPSLIFRRCDSALYESKQRGRNCTTIHDGVNCLAIDDANTDSQPQSNVAGSESPDSPDIKNSKVMIIDDEASTAVVVKKYLKTAGFGQLVSETDSTKAVERIISEAPDLILLDIHMPQVSGMDILKTIRDIEVTASIPVVFLTSSTNADLRVEALNLGANDFLNKPVVVSELVARVKNTLMAKAHVDLIAGYSVQLEHQVETRTAELIVSRREAIQCLARAAELRDDITGRHVIRVGRYASIIAKDLGMDPQRIADLEHAAQLHDVGKIGIPDAILNKPGKLTDEEYDIMRQHCRAGSRIISGEKLDGNKTLGEIKRIVNECSSPVMRLAALVAETHHEKWDGTGYPHGLQGEDIPIEGRITAVCDVFDAISTKRPYKDAFPIMKCFEIIRDGSGSHFDPNVVQAFFRQAEAILSAFNELSD